MHLMRMKVSKLSGEQLRALERSIENYRELVEDHRLKNVFSDIYNLNLSLILSNVHTHVCESLL